MEIPQENHNTCNMNGCYSASLQSKSAPFDDRWPASYIAAITCAVLRERDEGKEGI